MRAIMRVGRGCWRLRIFSIDCAGFWTQSVANTFPRKAWERVGNELGRHGNELGRHGNELGTSWERVGKAWERVGNWSGSCAGN